MPYNVAIIGAARRKQGTGPFVAKLFSSLGHNVVGIVGTSDESSQQACVDLHTQYNIRTQAYRDFESLLAKHRVDIVAICSPPSTHLYYLEQVIDRGLHVFCEKPLWWPDENSNEASITPDEYLSKIQSIVTRANQQQCLIHINTQWPYTLKYFYQLFPSETTAPQKVDSFAMQLSPASKGTSMIVDATSHGLSMLYQLVGSGSLQNLEIDTSDNSVATHMNIQFEYAHTTGTTKTSLELIHSTTTPKPASYQINNLHVDRTVALPDYRIQLQSPTATLAITDPLLLSIQDFIASIEAGLTCDQVTLVQGASDLFTLIHAHKQR